MTFLLVQTFLLLLGAFLLGASLACVLRRAFSGRTEEAVAAAGAPSFTANDSWSGVPSATGFSWPPCRGLGIIS